MPGVKRTSVSFEEDEESSLSSGPDSSTPKRARYGRDAVPQSRNVGLASTVGTNIDNSAGDDDYLEEPHQPGAIVRVTLNNFVTYTSAEFHPGPSLNMVIGPNGTGKSTLVCAICLGLGWDPANLGRAKQIGEFVKHGSAEATIEIELASAAKHTPNHVIRRKIRKEGNKSQFIINGQQSNQKNVVTLAKSLAIQIDNLCQFLPQDRVVEFASLTPIALLRETLRAAASEEMVQWHDDLKLLRTQEKEDEMRQQSIATTLKDLQKRQESAQSDMERWRQREELITKEKALQKCRPWIERKLLRNQIEELKGNLADTKAQLGQCEEDAAPARAAQQDMEEYKEKLRVVKIERQAVVARAKERSKELLESARAEQEIITDADNEVNAEKQGERGRVQDIKRIERVIADLKRDHQQAPVAVDDEAYRAHRENLTENRLSAQRDAKDVQREMVESKAQLKDIGEQLKNLTQQRDLLDTQSGKQANLLKRLSADTWTGWDWIQKNRDSLSLKGEIYGPPILTCKVTDPRYANIVEANLNQGDFTAITFTNGDDQRLISEALLGRNGPRLHQITLRSIAKPLSFYSAPVTDDHLRQLGFDGWVLNHIEGPEPVLAMLCDSKRLHRIPFSLNPLSEMQSKQVEESPISQWTEGDKSYKTTRRREYGSAATSTQVNHVRPAQVFVDQPVSDEDKRRLDDRRREVERDRQRVKEEYGDMARRLAEHEAKAKQAADKLADLDREHKDKKRALAQWNMLPRRISEKEQEIESIRETMSQTAQRILQAKETASQAELRKARLALELRTSVCDLERAQEDLVEVEIRLVEAISEVDALEEENTEINNTIRRLKTGFQTLRQQKESVASRFRALTEEIKRFIPELTDEEKTFIEDYKNLASVEELEHEIDEVTNKLSLLTGGNPDAVRHFADREKEIERKQRALEQVTAELETTRHKITDIREQWEPQLDELVATISEGFSHNFKQIGCAGQVDVDKDEDFEKWSIKISVRFREHETLTQLDSHRQSGGERAVSTIFYLMALQDLARSPFRVVDEINQGMDPRNERMVHERMVDIACQERTSQYFLITPKLLSDLKFHPKMKIHCIASGEHMPESKQAGAGLDFARLAEVALRRKGVVG
ncbi:structural maintenance of chromosomes protein 5 [Sporormia fimetaria CBS 119925]|uniref:Structural maintenance of chromosomes protein 5 n=1 Tax=Sporormia fimetaria CBS 119925 TaxID=1340428 RepID=A0A6A6V5A6_9PLEO|nr:structural maintenance of chromosomes protein 5 [Sporormia fimetaria CBS 119925]